METLVPFAGDLIMDTEYLRDLAEDIEVEGVLSLLLVFQEDAPPRLEAMRRALTEGAIQTVRREAHALAGAAGTVGLPRLHEAATSVARFSETAGPIASGIERIDAALREASPLIAAWFANDGTADDARSAGRVEPATSGVPPHPMPRARI